MQKTGDSEGGLEILRGHEASALDKLERKFGKRLADFDDDERSKLHDELAEAKKKNEADAKKDAEDAK